MTPHLDTFWKKVGLSIPLLAGAITPRAIVAAIQGLGFSTSGIASGSTAATMMSFGGGTTAAGGIVATLQSIGALGALSASAALIAAFSGAAISALVVYGCVKAFRRFKNAFRFFFWKRRKHNPDNFWNLCKAVIEGKSH